MREMGKQNAYSPYILWKIFKRIYLILETQSRQNVPDKFNTFR